MPANTTSSEPIDAGVIGVGSMGRHHARIYSEMPDVTLVGVQDVAPARARSVAREFGTSAMETADLLSAVDVVSVAVPTAAHYETVATCLDHGVHVLVEKPFVADPARGRELARMAADADLVLQVGHIERFNPAIRVLDTIISDLDIVAVDIQRLGPPLDRDNDDSVVMDLMIHDVDIMLSLIDAEIDTIGATARDERHAMAQFQFENDSVGSVTASRLTQQKVRRLAVTARSCRVNVDFIEQSVEIHRSSLPEYVEADGDIRYRHESVVERPMVENGEPLRGQIDAFVSTVREGGEPVVTPADALRVLEVIDRIETLAFTPEARVGSA